MVHYILKLFISLLSFLLIATVSIYAQTSIEVTSLGSITIPYPFEYSFMRSNGDVQFYHVVYSNSSIQFYEFHYQKQLDSFTQIELICTFAGFSGLNGSPETTDWVFKFEKLYLLKKLSSNLLCFVIDYNNVTLINIPNVLFPQFEQFQRLVEVVTENEIAIVENNRLLLYDLNNSTFQVLLEGQSVECMFGQSPVVWSLGFNYFVYSKDSQLGMGGPEEVWYLFTTEGVLVNTMISSNIDLLLSVINTQSGSMFPKVLDHWYINHPQILMTDGFLECSVNDQDSLDLYTFTSPYFPEHEWCTGFCSFWTDKLLFLYYNDVLETQFLYIYNSPMALQTLPIQTYNVGNSPQLLTKISERISIIVTTTNNCFHFGVFWIDNLTNMLSYNIPINVSESLEFIPFVDGNILRLLTANNMYSFNINETSGTDNVILYNNNIIDVYPNPVSLSQQLTISTNKNCNGVLEIYNIKGQHIKTYELVNSNKCIWDLSDKYRQKVSTGVYLIRIRSSLNNSLKKVLLIK
ncbi:MAG: T9SS type A sorting domain-containing protein [Candidatus Cloacimonetes bacterium]|nr:T9SS type A sorting domain-containing protein [Candidatus Cloacimonadota bacterium]